MRVDTDDVIRWIRENCLQGDVDAELSAETPLLDGGMLDSMQIMSLVSYVEERIGLMVPIEDVAPENFETPASVAAMAGRLTARRG